MTVVMHEKKKKTCLQYGCGWSAPETWLNFDASPTLRYERIPILGKLYTKNKTRFPANVQHGDITKGLPVPDNSCGAVYCSHVLEHLSLNDFRIALHNTFKLLVPGGIFRFVMPDLEYMIQNYINDSSPSAAIAFLQETLLGQERRNRNFREFFVDWLGNSHHLWLWDYKSAELELKTAGFTNIRRAFFGDSDLGMFNDVEVFERWENCLGIECQRDK